MTARAFLSLSDELRTAFAEAQDDENLRYLHVKIVNEGTLTAVGSRGKGAGLRADFDALSEVGRCPPASSSGGPSVLHRRMKNAALITSVCSFRLYSALYRLLSSQPPQQRMQPTSWTAT